MPDTMVVYGPETMAERLARRPGYHHVIKEGDRVRLPDGREGTVYMIEFHCGGNVMVASIRPDKPKLRWFGLLPAIPVRLADEEIDQLKRLPTEEEMEEI